MLAPMLSQRKRELEASTADIRGLYGYIAEYCTLMESCMDMPSSMDRVPPPQKKQKLGTQYGLPTAGFQYIQGNVFSW